MLIEAFKNAEVKAFVLNRSNFPVIQNDPCGHRVSLRISTTILSKDGDDEVYGQMLLQKSWSEAGWSDFGTEGLCEVIPINRKAIQYY